MRLSDALILNLLVCVHVCILSSLLFLSEFSPHIHFKRTSDILHTRNLGGIAYPSMVKTKYVHTGLNKPSLE